MFEWVAWPVAAVSTILCLALWFREVRRIMRDRKSMVESAESQLATCREKAGGEQQDPGMAAVLERSEKIYQQAVELYTLTLRKLWVRLPARLLGFHPIDGSETVLPQTPVAQPEKTTKEPAKETYFGSVRFFKNMILLAVIVMIAVPAGAAVYLNGALQSAGTQLQKLTADMETLKAENHLLLEEKTSETAAAPETVVPLPEDRFEADAPYADLYPEFYAPQSVGAGVREEGVIYLTFDDGPSARTAEILDTLREKGAKATFFVIGNESESGRELMQRIVQEGHTLAMHSYSHDYNKIYASVEDYLADMYQVFNQIKEATGVTPTLFRFPGGSINGYNRAIYQDLISEMLRRGFIPYDWNISSADAASAQTVPVDTLIENVMKDARKVTTGIVLMHDSAAKRTTAQALGPMIDRLRELGFELKALTPDVKPILYGYRE